MDTMVDPLQNLGSENFSDQDTSMPLLPSGMHTLNIKDITSVESKKVPGNYNMLVEYETTEEVQAHESEQMLAPGWGLRQYYPLQHNAEAKEAIAAGRKPKWDFRSNIARLMDAVYGTTQADRPSAFNKEELINQQVVAKVLVTEMEQDGQKTGVMTNEIKSLSHPVE